jgi:ketosteroid isomerase-like protein
VTPPLTPADEATFRALTERPFTAVNALDLEGLRGLVDDDFGIVDVDPTGRTVLIDDLPGWDAYMREQMAAMRAAGAALRTDVLDHRASVGTDLAHSVVRFRQHVDLPGGPTLVYDCVATVVWKLGADGAWREARWHCSPLGPPA